MCKSVRVFLNTVVNVFCEYEFDKSKIIRAGFGDDLVNSYVKLKNQDWGTFNKHLSSWERETTLDC